MLDAKIRELNSEVGPRELEIEALKGQIATVDKELVSYHAANRSADARIGALREELGALQAGMGDAGATQKAKRTALAAFERDLYSAVKAMGSRAADAVEASARLEKRHAPPAGRGVESSLDLDVIAESVRQQQHLSALNATLRAQASSKPSLAGGDAAAGALITENATLLTQIASLKAVTKRIRAETAALVYKAQLAQSAAAGGRGGGGGASGVGARAAASLISSASGAH